MAKIGELIVSIVGDNSSLNKSLDDSGKKVQDFGSKVVESFGALAALAGIAATAIKGIEFNKAAEQAQVSFEVMTGSAQVAADTLRELRDFANKTPLEFKDIRDATQTMLSFGISANDAVKYVKMLGDVSGGNADKLKSLSLAFSQIRSTGRLMGQDLLQLINAGFNPLNIISEQTGKSMAELKMEMEKGAISADMVTAAFESATAAGGMFNGMLERQGQTLAGAQSTFSDAFDTFLGEGTSGLTQPLVQLFKTLTEGLGKTGDNFKSIGDAAGGLVSLLTKGLDFVFKVLDAIPGPILAIVSAIGVAKIAMVALSATASTLGITMSSALGPVGIALAAIAAGIGLVVAESDKAARETTAKFENLGKELGVSAEEAQKLQKGATSLGVSIAELQRLMFKGKIESVEFLQEYTKNYLSAEKSATELAKMIDTLAKKYGVSRELIVKMLERSTALTAEEMKRLKITTSGQDAVIRNEYEKNKAIEDGNKKVSEATAKKAKADQDAKAAADLARRQKEEQDKKDAEAAKKRAEDERKRNREDLEQFLMSEEEKLLAEKKRLLSAAKNKDEQEEIEKAFSQKIIELKQREEDRIKSINEAAENERTATLKKRLDAIEITTQEQLDAYIADVNAAKITEDQKKKLIEDATEELKKNIKTQKQEFMSLVDDISSTVSSLASSLEKIWDANLTTRLQQIEDEKNAALAAAGFLEETEMQRLIRERDAAIEAGNDVLADEKRREIERQKILDDAAKKAAQAEYDAAMNAWTLKQTMAIVDAAVAVIKIWAGDGSVVQKVVDTAATVVVTAAELAVINSNKPKAPALWTGTTNPIRSAGQFIVGDQGPELVTLPEGSTVKNNRDTMDMMQGGGGGIMRSTIVVNLDRQTIAQSTVDLINNGQVYLEAI